MKSDAYSPIPIPPSQRWHDIRVRVLPAAVCFFVIGLIAILWKQNVPVPTLVGQAEPVIANVNSSKPGMLAAVSVSRFQQVKTGEVLGQVLVADPRVVEASIKVIQTELDVLRTSLQPIAAQQRNAVNYVQVRLDWMRQRADLAALRARLQFAEAEFHRAENLFKEKVASQSELDLAQGNFESLQKQSEELTKLVGEVEQNFKGLNPSDTPDLGRISDEPLRAAFALQESKLRLTEAELSPVLLSAPMDGIVTTVYHQSGEAVRPGEPIFAISAANSVRIVGYLRPPFAEEPKPGARVEVRTRGLHRALGVAQIVAVGTQFETIPTQFLGMAKPLTAEIGLPLSVSLPSNLKIRPGELVDLTLPAKGRLD